MGSHSFQQIVGYRNLAELSDKLDRFSFRVTKEEALDLPDKIYTVREVGVTDEQLKYYQSIKTAAMALLDDGELVSAPAIMTQLLRLQQVLCGHVMTDDGESTGQDLQSVTSVTRLMTTGKQRYRRSSLEMQGSSSPIHRRQAMA